jgi:CheY-like chemotaxis protein
MSRALSGFLDDVDLDEVLRVIALSRRSGLLDVDGGDGDNTDGRAELHFVTGRLVRARLHDTVETVGSMLVRAGVLDERERDAAIEAETLEDLVARIERGRGARQLLVRVDDAISQGLEDAVSRVLAWRQGSFTFRVTHETSAPLRYPGDTAFTLPAGVDAEELSREAKRRRAERNSDPLASFGVKKSRPKTMVPGRPEVLVVDDDPIFLAAVERVLGEAGVSMVTMPSAQRAIDRVTSAVDDGVQAIVVDLVMPRSNGRGILGGLELLRAAHAHGAGSRVFLALEEAHDDAERLATSLGAGVLRKPTARDELAGFLNPVLLRLDRPPLAVAGFDLARELSRELPDSDDWRAEWHDNHDDNFKSLETLKALLVELNNPSFDEEIPLLLLRFASAFFVRGALFSVDHARRELVGLGGFGVGGSDPGRLVRSIRIPLSADTVFARAIAERCGLRQAFWDSEWNTRLASLLGGPRPREVYTAPLTSPRGLEGVLYADNGTDPRPFPDIALLEIFLQQAAAALERAMLSRELHTLRASQLPQPAEQT